MATWRVSCDSSNDLGYIYSSCDPSGRQALSASRAQAPAPSPSIPSSNASAGSESVNEILSQLMQTVSRSSLYGNVTSSASNASTSKLLNAAYLCRGDLTHQECVQCVQEATQVSQRNCMNADEASIILNGCILRYQETSLFNLETLSLVWGCSTAQANSMTNTMYKRDVGKLVNVIINEAPTLEQLFSAGVIDGKAYKIYGVAQCWPYVDPDQCGFCLSDLADTALSSSSQQHHCGNSDPLSGIRLYHASCTLGFEDFPFFKNDKSMVINYPSTGSHSGLKRSIVGVVVLVALATVLISLPCICKFGAKRLLQFGAKKLKERFTHKEESLCDAVTPYVVPSSQSEVFLFQQLQNASHNFHLANKLGDGGYGSVYKGVLWDGREVALKRLHSKSHQGEQEFFNEVNIITTVQHRNLIRLFGCCAEGSERILVYEYLKNKSLDKYLFGAECADGRALLSWHQRYEIITGIARGLAYLHEESRVCIVHRDIKPSNILLDENMIPKVADFGLARLCDQSHISTKIAGTIGYLAPEHAMTGRVTQKTDTYSFGLVVLEIMSGRRCWDVQFDEGLINLSWRLHEGKGQIEELVDPQLMRDWIKEEAIGVMRAALLCLQENEERRPCMSRVVSMLSERSYKFDPPIMPPWGVGERARAQLNFSLSSSMSLIPK